MKRFTVLLMVLCMVSISQAVMIGDFETGLDNFVAIGSPAATLSTSTTEGTVTSGSQSLKIVYGGQNYWPFQWNAPTVPAKLGILSYDVTIFAADWTGNPWTSFDKIAMKSNGAGGGWVEIQTPDANWKNRDGTASSQVWGPWDGDVKRTCTVDCSSYSTAGATWFQIAFAHNINITAFTGLIYIDNVHWLDKPNTPNPSNGGIGVIGTTLSWENSTSSLNEVNVWFGSPAEPNLADPNTILSMNTYKTLLTKIYTETSPGATSSCPMPAGLIDGKKYTWCVDSEPNNFPIPFWTFTATTNNQPVANAGADKFIYTYTDINNITITLNGSATDDGKISPLTYTWTKTAGPAATINSPNSATTTVTLTGGLATTTEAGSAVPYVFQLAAFDGQFTGTDDIIVHVNTDSCRASIENSGFYYYGDIAGAAGAGGNNRDCKVDLYDFAEMAINWLGCTDTFEGCL